MLKRFLWELFGIFGSFLIALSWALAFGVWLNFNTAVSVVVFVCVFTYYIIKDYFI